MTPVDCAFKEGPPSRKPSPPGSASPPHVCGGFMSTHDGGAPLIRAPPRPQTPRGPSPPPFLFELRSALFLLGSRADPAAVGVRRPRCRLFRCKEKTPARPGKTVRSHRVGVNQGACPGHPENRGYPQHPFDFPDVQVTRPGSRQDGENVLSCQVGLAFLPLRRNSRIEVSLRRRLLGVALDPGRQGGQSGARGRKMTAGPSGCLWTRRR